MKDICTTYKIDISVPNVPVGTNYNGKSLKQQLLNQFIGNSRVNTSTTIESELAMLNTMHVVDDDVNTFYKENEHRLPILSKIAKPLFMRPMTTSKSEAVFSISGHLINSKRAAMNPSGRKSTLYPRQL